MFKDDTARTSSQLHTTKSREQGVPNLSNVSLVHTLLSNNAKVNKTEKKFQQLEGLLKQRMMEEANEEFKQTGEIMK
jgi:hypothetical protein